MHRWTFHFNEGNVSVNTLDEESSRKFEKVIKANPSGWVDLKGSTYDTCVNMYAVKFYTKETLEGSSNESTQ